MPPMRPDEPDNPDQDDRPYRLIELVEIFAQVVPVLTSFHPEISQSQTPWERPNEGVKVKSKARHARDAGWQSYERTNHRQHAANQHGQAPVRGEKALTRIQVLL